MKVLLTGCAGFIGSHLLEECLLKGWTVIGVDNMSTGREENLAEVFKRFNQDMSRVKFTMIRRDVLDLNIHAVAGADVILHQAALGSVPRSIEDPVATYQSNDAAFFHILNLARIARVKRVVYASSSSVYGDNQISARDENQRLGLPLSPYAATKQANEAYAAAFCRSYKMDAIGLRYFNVYGPRQATHAYTGVIARWADDMRGKKPVYANGDLGISRDFTYVKDVAQANILCAERQLTPGHRVYNVGSGEAWQLHEVFHMLAERLGYNDLLSLTHARAGDVKSSLAVIDKIRREIGFTPQFNLESGLGDWLGKKGAA